jgi:hypothetical protein
MGYYIEVPRNKEKAVYLIAEHGAELTAQPAAFTDVPAHRALVVVVDNGLFEAAGYAYDEREFQAFTQPGDHRPKQFLLMDKAKVRELTGTTR